MTEIHDRVFGGLVQAVDINAVVKIIRCAGVVDELDLSFCKAVAVGDQLIEVVVCVIDRQRGRAGEVAVRPGIREHVHRNACCLQGSAFCELHGIHEQIAVRLADQAVFIEILLAAFLPLSVEIVGQEMERSPYASDILQTDFVRPGVHHL